MNHFCYSIILTFALLFLHSNSFAQPKRPNQTNEYGVKVGHWQYKDSNGKIMYEGHYNEEGKRDGEWYFYLAPVKRHTTEPDLIGNYKNGEKHGDWQYIDAKTRNLLKGKFLNDQIAGEWIYYDKKGRKLASGYFNSNFMRHGQWVIYYNNAPMTKGLYDNGLLSGQWLYDYYHEDSTVHIKGDFNYNAGNRTGYFEHYKVLRDPKFPIQESLVGHGAYSNGKKTGRWIEYSPGLKGEKIEIGHYDGNSQRTGLWETTINGKRVQEAFYNNGLLQGSFKNYYENGKPQYVTFYEKGLEHGAFSAYYESGKLKEKGHFTISNQEFVEDTIYKRMDLPYEFNFMIIDSIDLDKFNYNAISWITDMHYSYSADELFSRWKEVLNYGANANLQIESINKKYKHSVRSGEYVRFYESGNVHLEGSYLPYLHIEKTGENSYVRSYARHGVWKEYDDVGYLKKIHYYEDGKLIRITDDADNPLNIEEHLLK